jgi:hypothetical protein
MSDDNGNNLINLDEQRKTKASASKGKGKNSDQIITPEKVKIALLMDAVVDAMVAKVSEKMCVDNLPAFPEKYHVVMDERGTCQSIKEESNGIVRPWINIRRTISQYVKTLRHLNGFESWLPSHSQACVEHWFDNAPITPTPHTFRMKSDQGLCYHRLLWDPVPNPSLENTPLFKELMGRCTNKTAVMAFLGSIYVHESDRQQYLWIYGEGQNGKGSLLRLLQKDLGPAYAAKDVPKQGDRFWNGPLIGKRLVGFAECERPEFPTSSHFKSLTGGDNVEIDSKGEKQFTTALNCKFIFMSNTSPQISSAKNDMRRIIYSEIGPITTRKDPRYEKKLEKEYPEFISYCVELYHSLCSDHGEIPIDEEVHNELANTNEEMFEYVFNSNFVVARGAQIPSSEMAGRISELINGRSNQEDFRKWLESKKGIVRKPIKINGSTSKYYVNVKLKAQYNLDQSFAR